MDVKLSEITHGRINRGGVERQLSDVATQIDGICRQVVDAPMFKVAQVYKHLSNAIGQVNSARLRMSAEDGE